MSRDAYPELEAFDPDLDEANDVPFDDEEAYAEEPCPGCGSTIDCEADCPELALRCAQYSDAFTDPGPNVLAAEILERTPAPRCRSCGCTNARACPGGCVWATEDRCSRCVA